MPMNHKRKKLTTWRFGTKRFSCIVQFFMISILPFSGLLFDSLIRSFSSIRFLMNHLNRMRKTTAKWSWNAIASRSLKNNFYYSRKELPMTTKSLFRCDEEQSTSHKRVWKFLKVWHVGNDSYMNLFRGFKAQVDSFVSCVGLWKLFTREHTKHSRVVTYKEKIEKICFWCFISREKRIKDFSVWLRPRLSTVNHVTLHKIPFKLIIIIAQRALWKTTKRSRLAFPSVNKTTA